MANLNPVAVVRDMSSSPQSTRLVHQIVGRFAGGGSRTTTIETKLQSILSAIVINETDGAVVVPTIGDSSAYTGTKTVAFSVANSKTYSYVITGLFGRTATVDAAADADATVTYEPRQGA